MEYWDRHEYPVQRAQRLGIPYIEHEGPLHSLTDDEDLPKDSQDAQSMRPEDREWLLALGIYIAIEGAQSRKHRRKQQRRGKRLAMAGKKTVTLREELHGTKAVLTRESESQRKAATIRDRLRGRGWVHKQQQPEQQQYQKPHQHLRTRGREVKGITVRFKR